MAQPSIASYFANRKRPAIDDVNIVRAKKVLVLDSAENFPSKKVIEPTQEAREVVYSSKECTLNNNETLTKTTIQAQAEKEFSFPQRNRLVTKLNFDCPNTVNMTIKKTVTPKSKPKKAANPNQQSIQSALLNMQTKNSDNNLQKIFSKKNVQHVNEKTPPASPVKNALDNLQPKGTEDMSLNDIKNKLTRSSRLAELKASLARFNKSADKLREIEKKTETLSQPKPTLKTFKSIELEVEISPKKLSSPVKPYLSPKKEVSPRKNLFGLLSPNKKPSPLTSPVKTPAYQRYQSLASPGKPSLTLPFKYRSLAEMFRAIDTVCAIFYNRKETITFNKLKPAVQEMLRRNLTLQHFAQVASVYPDAFSLHWEKIRSFATVSRQEKYELVIIPQIPPSTFSKDHTSPPATSASTGGSSISADLADSVASSKAEVSMMPTCLLDRRRKLFNILLEKVKKFHSEFLQSLDPPLVISQEKITRWHPEFDVEKVPDVESAPLPTKPEEEVLTSGQEVLEKARSLFNCNTRMEKALEKLKALQEKKTEDKATSMPVESSQPIVPSLKGIPKALLEKVRAKQAAKALDAMTRSAAQDKDSLMYSRLPDIARLLRNTFVAEKKGVLPLEEVITKLNNSYRSYMTNSETEAHLRLLSKVVPGWIVFHEVRRTLFVKVSRDGDMGKVMARLEELVKQKCT